MSKRDKKAILGDLETLRSLLTDEERKQSLQGEEAAEPVLLTEEAEPEVPVLDDVVDGGLAIDERVLGTRGGGDETEELPSRLDDDTIAALMKDQWREAARELLSDLPERGDRAEQDWGPLDREQLNAALKVRIDDEVAAWLRVCVVRHLDELREVLRAAIQAEIDEQLEQSLYNKDSN